MPEGFVPLAALLRGECTAGGDEDRERLPPPGKAGAAALAESDAHAAGVAVAGRDVGGELALMRLASLEAFERAAQRMLRRLALDVLGRESLLAPVEVDALVARAVASLSASSPVALALSAADAERVRSALPIRIDPALVAGDFIVDVRDGSIESHFAFRLASVLECAEDAV